MNFDVPKLVRSLGCDHGHDEESRNGRDIKIDILEAYVWTSKVFRVKSGFFRSTGRLPEPPGNLMGLSGPRWKRGEEARAGPRTPPPPLVRIGQGEGGGAPLSLSLPTSFPLLVGVLLLLGGGLLLLGALTRAGRPPPLLLYIKGQGAP